MGADKLAEIAQMPQNLSAQAQKFGIWWKKASLGVRSPWIHPLNSPNMMHEWRRRIQGTNTSQITKESQFFAWDSFWKYEIEP